MMDILDRPKLLLEQKILDQDAVVHLSYTKNGDTYIIETNNALALYDDIVPLSWWRNGIEINITAIVSLYRGSIIKTGKFSIEVLLVL